VKILLVVNDSPWGSTLSMTALRISRQALEAGHGLEAVFFRGDGVYHATAETESDAGTPDTFAAWAAMAERNGTALMVCQSSSRRRLGAPPAAPFREAGLVEFADLVAACDRVLTF
jgi:sulfur relay protein TusD/DsrE